MKGFLYFFLQMPILLIVAVAALTGASHCVALVSVPQRQAPGIVEEEDEYPIEVTGRVTMFSFCGTCHQGGRSGADFTAADLDVTEMRNNRPLWKEVVRRLREREMPPKKFPQPTDATRAAMIAWIERDVLSAPETDATPGRLARRLQRVEYANTMRDLLGVEIAFGVDAPKDEASFHPGMTLSREHAAAYRGLAITAIDHAFGGSSSKKHAGVVEIQKHVTELCQTDCELGADLDAVRTFLANFMERAFRRPADAAEIEEYVAQFEAAMKDGESVENSAKSVLADVLTSPSFLFRVESTDADLRDYQLASRLSYFLLRSAPDAELLSLAKNGQLESQLDRQVERLVRDARSQAFVRELASSWLWLDKLEGAPHVDEELRADMRQETEMFIEAVMREDRSVLELLDADFTFVNDRLAQHYGLAGVHGGTMRRITLDRRERGGLLTHGSILTLTSRSATDTNPVNRGKWMLESLLGAPPIRPPAGILEAFGGTSNNLGSGSIRQLLGVHRANPSCANCHAKLDGLGMALENFDGSGMWRTRSSYGPVEAIGDLPGGEKLDGLKDLKAHLLKNRDAFVLSLSTGMLRNALGRKLDENEQLALTSIPQESASHNYRFSSVLHAVIQSEAFRGVSVRGQD